MLSREEFRWQTDLSFQDQDTIIAWRNSLSSNDEKLLATLITEVRLAEQANCAEAAAGADF